MRKKYSVVHLVFRKMFYKNILNIFLKDCERILDVGCGLGEFMLAARSEGRNVVGVDIDNDSLVYCKKLGLKVYKCDASNLKIFKKNYFDAIFCSQMIEHLKDPSKMLKNFYNVLKPNGKLIVITPTPYADFWHDPTHVTPYTKTTVKRALEQNGFVVLKVTYDKSYMTGIPDSEFVARIINLLPFKWAKANILAYSMKKV